jgi:hypothetical protein
MSGTTWENVYNQPYDIMERTRLDDGWIYRNRLVMGSSAQNPVDYQWQVAVFYVADVVVVPPPLDDQPQQRPEQHGESRANARTREDTQRAS